LETSAADPKGIEIRGKTENAMLKLGEKWRKKEFTAIRDNLWDFINKETSRCIKCYSCIETCPVCIATPFEGRPESYMVRPGYIPSDPMFHLRRFAHISDSCVNCGQCEELCPVEIPLALISHAIRVEADNGFVPKLGASSYKN
ncbi:MAG: 4Fe-4S binding protein, partial [Burkholderiales bacterium]|nr:4Fe-4S binding protein [Burkholderiales bacterium]